MIQKINLLEKANSVSELFQYLDVAWYEKQIREYDNPEESFVCND